MKYLKAGRKILKLIKENQSYFEARPRALKEMIEKLWNLSSTAYFIGQEEPFIFELLDEEMEESDYQMLAQSAYSYLLSRSGWEKAGVFTHDVTYKENKTLPELLKTLSSEDKTEKLAQIFCTIGNGLSWTKDGFIDEGKEVALSQFHGPATLSPDIKKQLDQILTPELKKEMKQWFSAYQLELFQNNEKNEKIAKAIKAYEKDNGPLVPEVDRKSFSPMSEEYSLMCLIPDNAHESYLKGIKALCKEIIDLEGETSKNGKIALKALAKVNSLC